MTLLAMHPIEMWAATGRLQEDMIYRLLFCSLLGTAGVTLLSAGVVCDHLRRMLDDRPQPPTFLWTLLNRTYSFRGFALIVALTVPVLVWLIGGGVWTRVTAGYVDVHWSRVVLAGLLAFGTGQMFVTVLIVNLLRFHTARLSAGPTFLAADRECRSHSVPVETLSVPTSVHRQPGAPPFART
jgi:hypothetical protein